MRQWTIDAFASQPFKGNPACVVEPLDAWPDAARMQALAAESKRWEAAEQKVAAMSEQRKALETELAALSQLVRGFDPKTGEPKCSRSPGGISLKKREDFVSSKDSRAKERRCRAQERVK